MPRHAYADFDLVIEDDDGRYVAHVLDSPAGQASGHFTLPFTAEGLENFVLKMGHRRSVVRRSGSATADVAEGFGRQLYDAVFAGEVGTCFRRSLDEADRAGTGLRIRLRLSGAPDLTDIPWECMYSDGIGRFVAISVDTPLVRFLDLPAPARRLSVEPPLRVLVLISSPTDAVQLDVQRELSLLREATADLVANGRIELVATEDATLATLQGLLRRTEFHVLHFMGHGGYDERSEDGVLLFEGESARGRPVTGRDLGMLLHDHHPLRLAVLNACEGARASREDPFSGVAQSLVKQGLPAVIAMQFEITDRAAMVLAHEFYLAVSDGYPVDAALGEARKAMFAAGHAVEWATPVLYLRAANGELFDIAAASAFPPAEAVSLPEHVVPAARSPEPKVDQTSLDALVASGAATALGTTGESLQPPKAAAAEPPPDTAATTDGGSSAKPAPADRTQLDPPPPDAPPQESVTAPVAPKGGTHRRRPNRGPLIVIAGALVLVLTAVIGYVALRDGRDEGGGQQEPTQTPSQSVATQSAGTAKPAAWQNLSPPFSPLLSFPGVAVHGGDLWVVGGITNTSQRGVYVYDPQSRSWRPGPALPRPVDHGALASTGKQLYLIGGREGARILTSVYRLDDVNGAWHQDPASLPSPRESGAAVWDGRRVLFGGGANSEDQRPGLKEIWALQDGNWVNVGSLSTPREHLAAASDGKGTVWFTGGADFKQNKVFNAVDIVQGSVVSPGPPLPVAVSSPSTVWTPEAGVCVIGGSTDPPATRSKQILRSIQCFDQPPNAQKWPELPAPSYGSGAGVIGGAVYVAGGMTKIAATALE